LTFHNFIANIPRQTFLYLPAPEQMMGSVIWQCLPLSTTTFFGGISMRFITLLVLVASLLITSSAFAREPSLPSKSWATDFGYVPLNWVSTATTVDASMEDSHYQSNTLNLRFHTFKQKDGKTLVRILDNKCMWELLRGKRKGMDAQCEGRAYNILVPPGFNDRPLSSDLQEKEILRLINTIFTSSPFMLQFAILEVEADHEDMQRSTKTKRVACTVDTRGSNVVGMGVGNDFTCGAHTRKFTSTDGNDICVNISLCHAEDRVPDEKLETKPDNCKKK